MNSQENQFVFLGLKGEDISRPNELKKSLIKRKVDKKARIIRKKIPQ